MAHFDWPEAAVVLSDRADPAGVLEPRFAPKWRGPHAIEWYVDGHTRMLLLDEQLEDSPERFRFRAKGGEVFTVLPMSLELYEKHVRRHTVGEKHFESLRALIEAMQREC